MSLTTGVGEGLRAGRRGSVRRPARLASTRCWRGAPRDRAASSHGSFDPNPDLVATAVILIAALEPAVALGWSASRGGRAPVARAAQVGSPTSVANTERGSDPSGSSGPVARGQTVPAFGSGYGDPHGSQAVRGLQRGLANLGYAAGPIDGRYGPLTERAVIRFQTGRHLHVDGIAGPQTLAALAVAKIVLFPGAGYVPGGSAGAGAAAAPLRGWFLAGTDRRAVWTAYRTGGDSVPDRSASPR